MAFYDKTLMDVEQHAQAPAFYCWEPEGKPIAVELEYSVVDRLLVEVMRGFGAVPRRGAEVGGLLLGTSRPEEGRIVVHISDFEPVPCEHASGPSYLLSANDTRRFEEALGRCRPAPVRAAHVIGYYRSHTRDGLALQSEDLELFAKYFPGTSDVILLVKPFATRVSVGGFFFREGDSLHADSSYKEFPFRRKELGGGRASPDRAAPAGSRDAEPGEPESEPVEANEAEPPVESVAARVENRPNLWVPLAFILLVLGLLLGYLGSITLRPWLTPKAAQDAYSLALRVTKTGPDLHIRWDRQAAAIRDARSGSITIVDGAYSKRVDLEAGQLQNGSVIYHHVHPKVSFRLEVRTKEHTTVSETVDFDAVAAGGVPAGEAPPR